MERVCIGFLEQVRGFGLAIIIRAALRVHCVVFRSGTGDMDDWEDHALQVHNRGLIGYYHANEFAIHPPLMSAKLERSFCEFQGQPTLRFEFFSGRHLGYSMRQTAFLLFLLLLENRWRFFATAYCFASSFFQLFLLRRLSPLCPR
ncbi:MAG TPA: hypothetical protein VM717_06740 [Chthoniobacterales bacterium]|jgi:hypothetical protein|nr:hypothetical protein [Chthoniobacterales bacterium]